MSTCHVILMIQANGPLVHGHDLRSSRLAALADQTMPSDGLSQALLHMAEVVILDGRSYSDDDFLTICQPLRLHNMSSAFKCECM